MSSAITPRFKVRFLVLPSLCSLIGTTIDKLLSLTLAISETNSVEEHKVHFFAEADFDRKPS
jgi:hypothetical protein